ncbi:glutamine--tRNA ligase/YqeY domain fusion protein [Oceanobacter mangrovi]|uniref:glutamine--tRNA ligase/YqeY domain fusion protein n=1 Tax=Oceanobacter mangrovi TaxID=2862510 RepID=UPI001C8D47E4|nr:glutamine--tRNA ligase/YqeY domain fusion protein [Oceanobacter mangrovi]
MSDVPARGNNFVAKIIEEDLSNGKVERVITRFPPEPNGYLHVGHAKSICLNFGVAQQFGGGCNLRFDDTNPEKENQEFIDAIKDDVQWLGFNWEGEVHYASDYFDQLFQWAVHLIEQGNAYVCDLSPEQARQYRGTLTEAGQNSPYRDRSVEENLELFEKMRAGEFDEGACVLRAKIDMASSNMNLRDPIIYRIRKAHHHQTGDKWCIYPTYDFTHGQSDAIEGVTHSICTLEFEDHRPLYEWFIANLPVPCEPKQYEFGRLNMDYTVTSKRKLKGLVDNAVVTGWSDPRMPTISGMRRRGFTPSSIRNFCEMIGVTRSDGLVDIAMLEHAVRDDLNKNAPRAMCVINPVKVVIENLPQDHLEQLAAPYHHELELGSREMPFTRELYIDREDFKEEYSKKFKKKFTPGNRIRLRHSYVLEATGFDKNEQGDVTEIRAVLIENTLGVDPEDGIKPKGVVHWVSATHSVEAELRLYQRLFNHPTPDKSEDDYLVHVNPDSLVVAKGWVEPALAQVTPESSFQFEREGYYVADRYDHTADAPVFNLTIGLREDKELAKG